MDGSDGLGQPSPVAPAFPDWIRLPALLPLWRAAFRALQRNNRRLPVTIRLEELEEDERREIGALVERVIVEDSVRLPAAELEDVLLSRCGAGLLDVVEAALGPVPDRTALGAQLAQRREEPLREAIAAAGVDEPWVSDWADGLRRAGLVLRHQLTAEVLKQGIQAVQSRLAVGAASMSKVQLAAAFFGDAHALDIGSIREALVLRGIAAGLQVPLPVGVTERRLLWLQVGVSADLVSSTCLVSGLRASGSSGVAARLALAADDGLPMHLTAWDLQRFDGFLDVQKVLVCENPQVLEAVARRFGSARPAVCTSGQPGLVTVEVLRRLSASGTRLDYHGDFDWPGITIANWLVSAVGVRPWLMDSPSYIAGGALTNLPLVGKPVVPSWNSDLGEEMSVAGIAVHEEVVLDQLLDALT